MFKRTPWKKYNSTITEIDWIKFKSKIEARFYQYFKENNIEIEEMQPWFLLQEKFRFEWEAIRELKYIADFIINYNWYRIIIEVKGFKTPEFMIKKKLFLAKLLNWRIAEPKIKYMICKSIKDFEEQIRLLNK